MQGLDKTTLYRKILPVAQRRCGDFPVNRLRLGVGVLLPECIFVNQINKEYINFNPCLGNNL